MREYAKKPVSQSRTLDSNPKASRQTSIDVILQRYQKRNIQRYAEDEELIQGKLNTTQSKEIDKDELLQGKFEPVPASKQEAIQQEKKPNNTGLPDNLKTGIENLSGYSMDDVRVHYNSSKPSQLQALAYAQGTDIHIAPGQEQHLPHEAWHVVQQKQGRVQPTMQLQGVNINNNERLEKEADMIMEKLSHIYQQTPSHEQISTPIQKSTTQLQKDKFDIEAEEKINNLLIQNIPLLASTIDNKDLVKPFKTSLETIPQIEKVKSDSISSQLSEQIQIQKLMTEFGILDEKTDKTKEDQSRLDILSKINFFKEFPDLDGIIKDLNANHISMNWSLITSATSNLFNYCNPEITPDNKRHFAYLADPSLMLDRIISISSQDASSNSKISPEKLQQLINPTEPKVDMLKKVVNEIDISHSKVNSEAKSFSFNPQAFMGLLCNTDEYKTPNYYKDFFEASPELPFIRIFRYIKNSAQPTTVIKCIGKVVRNLEVETFPE